MYTSIESNLIEFANSELRSTQHCTHIQHKTEFLTGRQTNSRQTLSFLSLCFCVLSLIYSFLWFSIIRVLLSNSHQNFCENFLVSSLSTIFLRIGTNNRNSWATSASHFAMCPQLASWQLSFWRQRISKKWTSVDCLVTQFRIKNSIFILFSSFTWHKQMMNPKTYTLTHTHTYTYYTNQTILTSIKFCIAFPSNLNANNMFSYLRLKTFCTPILTIPSYSVSNEPFSVVGKLLFCETRRKMNNNPH